MPRYEYRCRSCGSTFELQRPMSESGAPATCPDGHDDTVRLLSSFASVGAADQPAPQAGPCGGSCACYPE